MKVLFDTSVLVASTIAAHATHVVCYAWVDAVHDGRIEGFISCHSLAECYRVLTAMPTNPRMNSVNVWTHMQQNLESHFNIVELTFADYHHCLDRVASNNFRSGIVFDALIVQAALKANVDKLLALNSKHFERLWPNHTDQVINPTTTQVP
jgi:predicted nucleic acid-binding protein